MIIDRLNAAKWRNIPKDLEWARVMISTGAGTGLNMEYLRRRAAEEDIEDYLEVAFQKNAEIMAKDLDI